MQEHLAEPPQAGEPASILESVENPIGQKPSSRSGRSLVIAARLILLATFVFIIAVSVQYGLRLRGWTWDQTAAVHFFPDVNNGIYWGGQAQQPAANPRGFLNVYDVIARTAQVGDDNRPYYGLDYAPLRLWLITYWVKWADHVAPETVTHAEIEQWGEPPGDWQLPYWVFAPLLRFNDAMEMAACIGLFLLARHWVIRGDKRIGSTCSATTWGTILRPFRGSFAGLIAVLLFWFAPAVMISTHGWPTWDEWVIPFFVWAIYFACNEWWFLAGLVIAAGAMFKGQQLFVAPLFVLWPLLMGRWRWALRWIAGMVLGIALIASPWLLTYLPANAPANAPVNIAANWPANASATYRHVDYAGVAWLIAVALCLIAAPIAWIGWRRHRGIEQPINLLAQPTYRINAALCFGLALLACGLYFSGSYSWLAIGWGFGLRHYPHMTMGVSDNLAGLLDKRFGWRHLEMIAYTFDPHPLRLWPTHTVWFTDPTDITIRAVLVTLYVIALLACIGGMAIQFRRNDPNFLIATTGVWLMFFTLMPQIHERYLLYAAGVGCTLTAVSVGMTLLNLFLMLLTFVMTISVMLSNAAGHGRLGSFGTGISDTFGTSLYHFCNVTYPDAGWAVLLAAAIFLFCSFRRSPVRTAVSWKVIAVPPAANAFPVLPSPPSNEAIPIEFPVDPAPIG